MARANWEYIRVDVLLPSNPKLDGLSSSTKWSLIELWLHCGQHRTDGFVRDKIWVTIGTPTGRRKLVERGLAERVRGGYQMHDYLGHQRSKAEIEALSAKRSAAGSKGGKAKASATASAKQVPPLAPASKGSKSLAEAEAEAEADLSEVLVGRSSADRNGRATPEICDLIIEIIETRTGRALSTSQAAAIAAGILAGRQPDNPGGYIRYVITNEPDPVRRFLSGPASEAGRHPSARTVAQAIAESTPGRKRQ
jgi:hypothetical protein